MRRGRFAAWGSVAALVVLAAGGAALSVSTSSSRASSPVSALLPTPSVPAPSVEPTTTTAYSNPTTTTPTPLPGTAVQITLTTTRAVAGDRINGTVEITNSGSAVNLTEMDGGEGTPAFLVHLTNGTIIGGPVLGGSATSSPFVIAHGTTYFRFSLWTTYEACGGTPTTPNDPPCSPNGEPPLPPGTYAATIEWSPLVPLPQPKPVEVTVLDG